MKDSEVGRGASYNLCPQTKKKKKRLNKGKRFVRGNSHLKTADESQGYESAWLFSESTDQPPSGRNVSEF